jgi:hypothetical protein
MKNYFSKSQENLNVNWQKETDAAFNVPIISCSLTRKEELDREREEIADEIRREKRHRNAVEGEF